MPLALIFDSPWIPGYIGCGHLEYYLDPELWFQANRRIIEEFPEAIVFPSWWVEYGMAAEPSALGAKIVFHRDQTPSVSPMLFRLEDVEHLAPVNLVHRRLHGPGARTLPPQKQRIFDAGYTIPVVAARGPLCTAGILPRRHRVHARPRRESGGGAQATRAGDRERHRAGSRRRRK